MPYWLEQRQKKAASRAERVKTVRCDTCGATVESTMRDRPPRGWIAHPTRTVTTEVVPGVTSTRPAYACSKKCSGA